MISVGLFNIVDCSKVTYLNNIGWCTTADATTTDNLGVQGDENIDDTEND